MKTLLLGCALISALGAETKVVLLGTGTPNPDPDRMGPSVAVVVDGASYVVDCGPGVVRRAAQAARKHNLPALEMRGLVRLFLTHLHSDHTAGLPDFIFTPAVTGRESPLKVYGPQGTRSMVDHVMAAWKHDLRIRLSHLEPAVKAAYQVRARELKEGRCYRDQRVRVFAIAVPHGGWEHAFAYRFETSDRTVVISGDTTYSENLLRHSRGADVLVHEVYSEAGWKKRSPEWRRYHAAYHTAAPDLGRLAQDAGVKLLVLYHQLPMGERPDSLLVEVRKNFRGPVAYGNDLDVF
jgi:ribonuclease Z